LVPSKMSAALCLLTFVPFSFCRLPNGSTTVELVVSGRSVSMGSLCRVHPSAADAALECPVKVARTNDGHTDLGCPMRFACPATRCAGCAAADLEAAILLTMLGRHHNP